MPDFEKKEKYLIYTQNSAKYPLFSTSDLIEITQYQFLHPTVELAKLNMRKDYVSLTFIKSKFK